MHERSLMRALLRQVESLVEEHDGTGVDEIRVQLGPLSGVEPLLLASAFDELSGDGIARGARLSINEVPLAARCLDCGLDFELDAARFRCPVCTSGRTRIKQGDGLVLESVTIVANEQTEEVA